MNTLSEIFHDWHNPDALTQAIIARALELALRKLYAPEIETQLREALQILAGERQALETRIEELGIQTDEADAAEAAAVTAYFELEDLFRATLERNTKDELGRRLSDAGKARRDAINQAKALHADAANCFQRLGIVKLGQLKVSQALQVTAGDLQRKSWV